MSKDRLPLQGSEFELLLAWLDPDRDRAAEQYVCLHERLTKSFESHGCSEPDSLADETFNRVAAQLRTDKEIHSMPGAYLSGVAKFVTMERCWRGPRKVDLDDVPPDKLLIDHPPSEDADQETGRLSDCLEECLAKLPTETQTLLLEYYSEDKTEKINTRERMAKRQGIKTGVLRNRIYKLRNSLRACADECLAA